MDATAAAIAAADADTTLEFDPVVLKEVYDRASRYIAGVPSSPGYIAMSTPTHDLIAVHSELIIRIPESVTYYSNNKVAAVDAVAELSDDVTILFAKRDGEPLPDIEFQNLDQQDGVSQKVVSFFPCMDTVAMFKGHIVLKNALSRRIGEASAEDSEPLSSHTFCFTCPYASSRYIDAEKHGLELAVTRSMTLGAPVFNLSDPVCIVGTLSNVGTDYNVKFARNVEYLRGVLQGLWGEDVDWLKGEDIVRPLWE